MALTLPYPNMDFVPLDILTASELDQMVANIEYIASGSVFPISSANIADNAITTAKIGNNAVTSSKIDFTTLGFGNYSLSEVDTGFTWIDGKKIYKKTVNFGSLPNASLKSVNHNISNFGYLVDYCGTATDGSTLFILPSPRGGGPLGIYLYFSTTQISIEAGSDRTGYNAYVTMYYTKSA